MSGQPLTGLAALSDLRQLAREGGVHFVGVGGAGMSALAELVLRGGGRVSGCDQVLGDNVAALRALGVPLQQGHDPAHVADAAAVVVTAAVPMDHPELVAARARGVPVLKRAQALGAIVNRGTVVAVAGTHGKTTTTAMTSAILAEAGRDPTALVGGRVGAWGSGLRAGSEQLYVVEADEYDRSFLTLTPTVAVLTSIEADHLDIFGDLAGVEEAFLQFLSLVRAGGAIVACADDAGAARVAGRTAAQAGQPITWYGSTAAVGRDDQRALRAEQIRFHGRGSSFAVLQGERLLGRIELAVPGEHNVKNALGALGAALFLGADFAAAARALADFTGVARRFQLLGSARGVQFIDDYAHHPTEIAATLSAARRVYPEARIVAVFQPHLYTRTRDLAEEFGQALAAADVVCVTGIYAAREEPLPGVSGALVARAAERAGAREVRYHESLAQLETALARELAPGDVCITMGAGDIDAAARRVLAQRQGEA